MRNVCPAKREIEIHESASAVELIRQINAVIRSAEDKLLHNEGIGLHYDSGKARWEFMVRDPKFDGLCRIFECSFLEHLRIADLHLYDIMVATLSHVWNTVHIPTWDDLLDHILEMTENDIRQVVRRSVEPYRTGAPSRCLRAVHTSHKRLPWKKLRRVVDAYNWNTPQKEKVLAWYKAAEKLCKTVRHNFHYYSTMSENSDIGEFVPTHELYGMYWSDDGPIDHQFSEYMNNQLGNFEPMPMLYRLSAETSIDRIRLQDGDVRMIDDWMVQSCHLMDYRFMQTYFGGQRNFKRWIKEVYEPIVNKPKSPLLINSLLEEVNVY